jgi:hypothetical protein
VTAKNLGVIARVTEILLTEIPEILERDRMGALK